jgi:hypothetical protein
MWGLVNQQQQSSLATPVVSLGPSQMLVVINANTYAPKTSCRTNNTRMAQKLAATSAAGTRLLLAA